MGKVLALIPAPCSLQSLYLILFPFFETMICGILQGRVCTCWGHACQGTYVKVLPVCKSKELNSGPQVWWQTSSPIALAMPEQLARCPGGQLWLCHCISKGWLSLVPDGFHPKSLRLYCLFFFKFRILVYTWDTLEIKLKFKDENYVLCKCLCLRWRHFYVTFYIYKHLTTNLSCPRCWGPGVTTQTLISVRQGWFIEHTSKDWSGQQLRL